jgi:hypothetical protein
VKRLRRLSVFVILPSLLAVLISACATTTGLTGGNGTVVQMIPDPTTATTTTSGTSLFPCDTSGDSCIDDTFAKVTFSQGFTFPFFGTTYDSVYINTNGGVTFGAGDNTYAPAATGIPEPGIAILWGDMMPGANNDASLHDEIDFQQFSDHFVISYTNIEDYDTPPAIENTATLTLWNDGTVTMSYTAQNTSYSQGTGLLVGVFDGSQAGYTFPSSLLATYSGYSTGHGVIVYNDNGSGGMQSTTGGLNGKTITFSP